MILQRRPSGFVFPSGVVGSGHHVVNRGVIPFAMKKSRPSAVDCTACSTSVNPYGAAISMPATKFGITFDGPKTSAAFTMRRTHSSCPM